MLVRGLARALCVGRLGLLYTFVHTEPCVHEYIACHTTRPHHPLTSPAENTARRITHPDARTAPLGRLTAESAPLLSDDGEEGGKLHGRRRPLLCRCSSLALPLASAAAVLLVVGAAVRLLSSSPNPNPNPNPNPSPNPHPNPNPNP